MSHINCYVAIHILIVDMISVTLTDTSVYKRDKYHVDCHLHDSQHFSVDVVSITWTNTSVCKHDKCLII
jgi:stress-induced morphogen